jgi:CAAX protease family protein
MDLQQRYQAERLPLTWFFVILFLCGIGAIPMILDSYGRQIPQPLKLLQFLMLFGPTLVAIIASYLNGGRPAVKELLQGLIRWRVHIGWYLLALLGPLVIYAESLHISDALGFTNTPFPSASKIHSTFLTTIGIYLLLNTEELAWRGYALPRVVSRVGILWGTVIIGLLWALFHSPLFWMKGGHPAGYTFLGFTGRLLLINVLFTAMYFGAARSVLMVHLLHQSLNAGVEAIPVYPRVAHSVAPMWVSTGFFFAIGMILLLRVIRKNPELTSRNNDGS